MRKPDFCICENKDADQLRGNREGKAGAFSRDFTTSLAPECRAFSGALKIEKLKGPLIPGPEGVMDTNDWCITCCMSVQDVTIYQLSSLI